MLEPVDDNFFLICDSIISAILQLDVITGNVHTIDIGPYPMSAPIAVAYDHVEGKIYWSDIQLKTINSANLDESQATQLLHTGDGKFSVYCKCVQIINKITPWV